MDGDPFRTLDGILNSGEISGGLDFLIELFRSEKNYPLLMEARLMRKRYELGLPLIQTEPMASFPADKQPAYEAAFIEAARETGELFLAGGMIERAWPYFRAIGETEQVAAAIERVEPGEGIEPVIDIAFHQGVHPVKGLELILAQFGMCRAITSFGMSAVPRGREECVRLLVRSLHAELAGILRSVIERQEGSAPESASVLALIRDRDWLFGEYDYYVDTSHVLSVIQYAQEITDRETLSLVYELCEYGKRKTAFAAVPIPRQSAVRRHLHRLRDLYARAARRRRRGGDRALPAQSTGLRSRDRRHSPRPDLSAAPGAARALRRSARGISRAPARDKRAGADVSVGAPALPPGWKLRPAEIAGAGEQGPAQLHGRGARASRCAVGPVTAPRARQLRVGHDVDTKVAACGRSGLWPPATSPPRWLWRITGQPCTAERQNVVLSGIMGTGRP
jgi:hypothetical protein